MEQYLQSNVSYQQEDWAGFLEMAEFAAKNDVSETTGASPSLANQHHHQQMHFPFSTLPAPSEPITVKDQAAHMDQDHKHLRTKMRFAQVKQKQFANTSCSPASHLQISYQVWLCTRNITKTRSSKTLLHKRLGPFTIIKVISSHTYHLALPPCMKIHPVFHISLLDPASLNPVPGQVIPPAPPVEVEGQKQLEDEKVLFSRTYNGKHQFLVQWLG